MRASSQKPTETNAIDFVRAISRPRASTVSYQAPEYVPQMIAPPFDNPEAEGRTNGGG
jgi:hypothetical protein